MQNKDREDNAFPFVMLLVILLGLASLELDEVVTSSSHGNPEDEWVCAAICYAR